MARIAACFVLVFLATIFIGLAPESDLIWIANGLLLAYLLLAPRWRWPLYLGAGFAAQFAGALIVEHNWRQSVALTLLNVSEAAIAAALLRRSSKELPRMAERAYMLRFLAIAAVAAPVLVGLVFGIGFAILQRSSPWPPMLAWVIADGLGAVMVTPACVAIFRGHLRIAVNWKRHWIYPAILAAASLAAFSQARFPVLFLIYPLLLLVLLRMGLEWASLCALYVAVVGSWCTLHGRGPFMLAQGSLAHLAPPILLQVFVAAGLFMLYSVSVVLEDLKSTQRRLQKIASLHALVTENSRDAILLVDFDGRPNYVSQAMQRMTGWSPQQMMKMGRQSAVHPDDREKLRHAVQELRAGRGSGMTEFRLRKSSGDYIWVESSLTVYVDPATHVPAGTMNIARDVTERKRTEEELRAAYRAVEALAVVDALTGIANRRRFDQHLGTEWRRGLREHKPLSLLLIDADHFKAYNDTYGHLRGDSCLKQIAEATQDVVSRPGDLVARYGGEEFAVVLPNTENDGAAAVAGEICQNLRLRKLPHKLNPQGIVTISVGCATIVPVLGQPMATLIELADRALYRAKHEGRNRVCTACPSSVQCGKSGLEPARKSA
jgi:diguanylate cyclase (GGDEF)-like protein/PAS domain S-box-containing protein